MPLCRLTRVFTLAVLVLCSVSSAATEHIELTLSYQTNPSPPYQMGSGVEIQQPPGIALDIINAAAQQLDLTIRYERYPNVRVLQLLESGMIDGAFMFSYKPQRAQIGHYPITSSGEVDGSKRLARLSYWLYSLPDSPIRWDGNELYNVNGIIAAEHGDSIISDLKIMGHDIQQPKSVYHALLMLKKRQSVVGAALQDTKAASYLAQPNFKDIKRSALPLRSKDYFLVLSRQFVAEHPHIAQALWDKVGQLRDEMTSKNLPLYAPNDSMPPEQDKWP
ncbi:hypothetical protein CHH28_11540 [Bacterioplanes sanyensis]|uniref:Solute-binding protein family 3/N-terminal domain-containing protein n=1 Tax=Bacterioplanes sanyensis TaxID=1249553 RepID=A0A222FKJ4_9GAMM|nr:hypothetical protein [Bacterioplanes sanyensis]ASP39269.1 hypothetical protein CHH28_11540 [Bacterioplanes sanyensis]